jgi:hypothetical protein
MSKTFYKKVEGKKLFPVTFFLPFFLLHCFAVSLHEELKNTIKILSKIRPQNLKKSGFFP